MNSQRTTGAEQATILAERLMRSIPIGGAIAAIDPKIFTAHLIELLTCYPQSIAERSVSGVKGLPALFEWMPTIAKIRETFEGWAEEGRRHAELMERYKRPVLPAIEGPPIKSMRDRLCERYGLRDIPTGWDAVDVVKASAKYGARLPEIVENMLRGPGVAEANTPAARVVEHARQAMLKRMGREDGDLSATPELRTAFRQRGFGTANQGGETP